MSHRIIIDTDPGQDDAIAILLALASPEVEVLGITSVAGNVPLPLTTKNTLKRSSLPGAAMSRSMPARRRRWCGRRSPPRTCTARPASTGRTCRSRRCMARNGHAADFIVDTLRAEPQGSSRSACSGR